MHFLVLFQSLFGTLESWYYLLSQQVLLECLLVLRVVQTLLDNPNELEYKISLRLIEIDLIEIRKILGKILINPHLNSPILINPNHIRPNLKIPRFLKHSLISLKRTVQNIQPFFNWNLNKFGESEMYTF